MTLTIIRIPVFALLLSATCLTAQITPAPVPYASVSELNGILGPLEQASQATQADLTKLRIDKWKMDSTYKKQVLGNTESVKTEPAVGSAGDHHAIAQFSRGSVGDLQALSQSGRALRRAGQYRGIGGRVRVEG